MFLLGFLAGLIACLATLRFLFGIRLSELKSLRPKINKQKEQSETDQTNQVKTIRMPQPLTQEQIKADTFLGKVYEIVDGHLEKDDFDIESLAQKMHLSRSQLFRKIKTKTGGSPSYFVRMVRLLKAREQLLNTPEMNISQVAYSVGFKDATYFSKSFSRTFGIPPRDLRQQRLVSNM